MSPSQIFYEDMMQRTEKRIENDTLTEQIIGAAIQVHRELFGDLCNNALKLDISRNSFNF